MIKKLIKVCLLLGWWGVFLLSTSGEVLAQSHDPLYDLCFTGKRGIAIGYYGAILVSEDGGNQWKRVPSGTIELLASLSFPDASHGWAVGNNGTILATSDGGLSWKPQNSGTANYLLGVYFVNAQKGWAVGEFGTILHTRDGGTHWQAQQSGEADLLLEGVRFLDEKRGFVVGEFGTILATSDGGARWTSIFQKAEEILDIESLGKLRPTLFNLDFQDNKIGVAVGVGGSILRSQDGGRTWKDTSSPTTNHLYRVKFINGNLYAVGLRGTLLVSADQGLNWKILPLPREVSLSWYYGVAGNAGEIFLAGENGKVFKQQNGKRK